jgi:AraC-like DNA-binding protein
VSRRLLTPRDRKEREPKREWLINPVVCRAGEFQFAPHQLHTNGCVQSRALFWCKSGHGTFTVNGQQFTLEPHDLYVLPWNRDISYVAGKKAPMFTAHVHIVPWMRVGAGWVPDVPHEAGEPLFNSPDRSDVLWPGFDSVVHLHLQAESALGRLINYTTQWFRESPRLETEARALGRLIVSELGRHTRSGHQISERRPPELVRMLVYVDRCLTESPTVDQLAAIISRSRSHVLKLFQRHLGVSAKTYIIGRQMREARELLLSTTLSISEVGRACGLPDPYHFSKLFRRDCGMPPRTFRAIDGTMVSSNHARAHPRVPAR